MERASEEREQATIAQLQSYDTGLGLFWHQAFRRYAVTARWPLGDPRYQLIQEGHMEDEPFDILGWLSVDIQDADSRAVNLEEGVERQLFAILARSDNQKTPWKQRLAQYAERNKQLKQKRKDEILDRVEHVAKDLQYMAGHNEEVRMKRIMNDIAKEGMKDGE